MVDANFMKKTGATPGKLALVGVLAVVLVVVVSISPGEDESSPIIQPRKSRQAVTSQKRSAGPKVATPTLGAGRVVAGPVRNRFPRTRPPADLAKSAESADLTGPEGPAEFDVLVGPAFKMPLAEAVAHDPFAPPHRLYPPESGRAGTPITPDAPPAGAAEAALAERYERLRAGVEGQSVTMVLGSGGGRVAVIGDETYHEGDRLGGLRIVEIRPEGVVVEAPPGEDGPAR